MDWRASQGAQTTQLGQRKKILTPSAAKRQGYSLEELQVALAHTSVTMTEGYSSMRRRLAACTCGYRCAQRSREHFSHGQRVELRKFLIIGRGEVIRTLDPLHPMQVQT